jgi:hypothetical protein
MSSYLLHRFSSGECIVATQVGLDYAIVRCNTVSEDVLDSSDRVLRTLQAFINSPTVTITAVPAYYNWASIQKHVSAFGDEGRVRSRCLYLMEELIGTALRPSRIERLITQHGMHVLDML